VFLNIRNEATKKVSLGIVHLQFGREVPMFWTNLSHCLHPPRKIVNVKKETVSSPKTLIHLEAAGRSLCS